MKTTAVLEGARELIADASRWTTGAFAKDGQGRSVPADSPAATCWCAAGAIRRVAGLQWQASEKALISFQEASYELFQLRSVTGVNDGIGHHAVLRTFDLAIQAERRSEEVPT